MCSRANTWSCGLRRTLILRLSTGSNCASDRALRAGWRNITNPWRFRKRRRRIRDSSFSTNCPRIVTKRFSPCRCCPGPGGRGRVVGAINLQHRRPHIYKRKEIRLISAIGFLVGAEIELARMEEVNSNLTDQLQTRKVVERAKGILQRELGLSEEQAYLALQKQSRQKRKAMREIAEAIILSEEVRSNTRAAEVS